MDRRKFIKWGSFLTVSVASTSALTACGGDNDDDDTQAVPPTNDTPAPSAKSFAQGIASGDPKPDSVVLWTRIEGGDGTAPVSVTVQVASDENFATLLVNTNIDADPSWDYTIRHKVMGLNAATTYFYRFIAGSVTSTTGRTKTAPQAGTAVSQMKFAFISCQDWSANHWGAFEEMVNEDLDFIVHLGDYIYEALPARFQAGAAEKAHTELKLPNGTSLADGSIYATTVADYRTLYKSYRSDPRLQAVHARFPMIAIWDDHEFSDDCWQDRQTYTEDDDATPQTARRRSANQAWFEFMPADVTLDLNNPSFENIQIYRSFSFGSLATLVMTDERLYRADHVIPESAAHGSVGSRYLAPKNTLSFLEGQKITAAGGQLTPVSMLGDTQRAWWENQMSTSSTTWKLWGNEVSLLRMQVDITAAVAAAMSAAIVSQLSSLAAAEGAMTTNLLLDLNTADLTGPKPLTDYPNLAALLFTLSPGDFPPAVFAAVFKPGLDALLPPSQFLGAFILDADQWDGYNAERKNMMSFLQSNSIQNVVALTGDIHAFFAGQVLDDFDGAQSPVMVDLVTAGISSTSLFKYYVNVVNTTPGLFSLASLVYQNVTNRLNGTLTAGNSWIKHADTDAQGYAVVTLTPTTLTCDFKKMKPLVNGVEPTAPFVASVATATVTAGTPVVTMTAV